MEDDNFGVIEDLLGLTDSTESSSSSHTDVFESHQPLILEVHDIVRNVPPPSNHLVSRVKKHKKRKRGKVAVNKSDSESSSSISNRPIPQFAKDKESREEFYDARESYHGLTEHRAPSSVPAAAILQAVLEDGTVSKTERAQPTGTEERPDLGALLVDKASE